MKKLNYLGDGRKQLESFKCNSSFDRKAKALIL